MSNENTENTTTNNQNIVGKLDSATLARRLAKTKAVRDTERNRQARRIRNEERRIQEERDERARKEEERKAMEAGKGFMVVTPFAQAAEELAAKLREEHEEATKKALRRREGNGRWISREMQKLFIATAEKLEDLGF